MSGSFKQIIDLELYQRIKSGWRRIALLPDVDDGFTELVQNRYPKPKYHVHLVLRMYAD